MSHLINNGMTIVFNGDNEVVLNVAIAVHVALRSYLNREEPFLSIDVTNYTISSFLNSQIALSICKVIDSIASTYSSVESLLRDYSLDKAKFEDKIIVKYEMSLLEDQFGGENRSEADIELRIFAN